MDNIGNDYASHFAQTRSRPQNYITDGDPATRFVEYPKLHELVRRKDALVAQRATPAMTLRTDLRQFPLASLGPRFFDVIVIDPPWKEYYDRARGVAKGTEVGEDPDAPPPSTPAGEPYWTWEDMAKLAIPDVAASPSFVFLWVGDGEGLDQGRKLLLQWGYRRCEDIVWVKTNKFTKRAATRPPGSVLERTKEHCLMGIKGTARRSTDAHFIHCNVDTDVIVAEEFEPGSTRKPDELFDIIEHFCLGRRRLYLFGEDHNVRPGWVTAGLGLTTSTYDAEQYHSLFCGPSSHLLGQDREIDSLRPKSPVGRDSQGGGGRGGAGNGRMLNQGSRPGQSIPTAPTYGGHARHHSATNQPRPSTSLYHSQPPPPYHSYAVYHNPCPQHYHHLSAPVPGYATPTLHGPHRPYDHPHFPHTPSPYALPPPGGGYPYLNAGPAISYHLEAHSASFHPTPPSLSTFGMSAAPGQHQHPGRPPLSTPGTRGPGPLAPGPARHAGMGGGGPGFASNGPLSAVSRGNGAPTGSVSSLSHSMGQMHMGNGGTQHHYHPSAPPYPSADFAPYASVGGAGPGPVARAGRPLTAHGAHHYRPAPPAFQAAPRGYHR